MLRGLRGRPQTPPGKRPVAHVRSVPPVSRVDVAAPRTARWAGLVWYLIGLSNGLVFSYLLWG